MDNQNTDDVVQILQRIFSASFRRFLPDKINEDSEHKTSAAYILVIQQWKLETIL